MAEKKAIKITQISKDFNLKSKDVLDVFKEVGLEKKTGGGAEMEEYELFLHKLKPVMLVYTYVYLLVCLQIGNHTLVIAELQHRTH